jgi:hypothetical protein
MVIVLKLNLNYAIVSKSTLQIFQNLSDLQQDILLYFTSFYKPKIFLFMTIQQVIANEKEINQLVLDNKSLEAFEKFYGENVSMTESDGSTTTGKAACRVYEEGFFTSVTEFRGIKFLSSVVMPSDDSNYEFLVVATWWYDFTTTQYTNTGNQTSLAYWKDGMIQKVTFKSGSEIIA